MKTFTIGAVMRRSMNWTAARLINVGRVEIIIAWKRKGAPK